MFKFNFTVILLILLVSVPALAQNNQFNADSAYAFIEQLTVNIGPRPMGSANDREALHWAVTKFNSFGADSAYVMVFTEAKGRRNIINTNSGISVGIFKGDTDSSIVIGGHIDSSGPEIPGANDDASGTASVIELARVWSQKPRHYTMVFAAFSGEEQGLIGSQYFVDHYSDLDKVALMLQIDMVGSEDRIITFLETKKQKAPEWLVKDAFALDDALEINRLQYPTNFFSLNSTLDAAGSDHQPFLEKNIPAIDFTAGINNSPIHSQQDNIHHISKAMLQRSGNLVDGLIAKYQQNRIPASGNESYMIWNWFGSQFYIPSGLILSLVIIALFFGTWSFLYSRKHRLQIEKAQRVRFSGLKLFLFLIIISVFTQMGEGIMQSLKGLRYPWLVPINKYLLFAAIWTITGFWVSLQITRKWRFSPDPYVYTKRALIILFVFTIIIGIFSVRLTFYPALTMMLFSLVIFISNPILKFALSILAPLPMFRLMFLEVFPFVARNSALSGFNVDSFWKAFFYTAAITAILVIWYLPAIYSFSYAVIKIASFKNLLKQFRRPALGLIVFVAIFGYGGYLYSLDAYNDTWRASIHVDANYDIRTGESTLKLVGNEYFRNVQLTADSINNHYDDRIHKVELLTNFNADWFKVTGHETIQRGEMDSVNIHWLLVGEQPWYRTTLTIQVDTLEISNIESDIKFMHQKNKVAFTWFAEPPESLNVTTNFTVQPGAKIIREITADYLNMPFPIEVTAELADVRYRTFVTYRDTLAPSLGTYTNKTLR